ncbi:UDP-N-acetylmuramoyl-L-alanine--D-glutamate ligase, partial [Streptomyces sp. NPDC055607]
MGSGQVTERLDWNGKNVTVAGLGVSGIPAARVLGALGARVTVVNDGDDERSRAQAAALEAEGITVRLGDGDTLPTGTELIVTAPGWRPDKPLFTAAAEAGVEVWGDVELAWRLPGPRAPPRRARPRPHRKTTTRRIGATRQAGGGRRTPPRG